MKLDNAFSSFKTSLAKGIVTRSPRIRKKFDQIIASPTKEPSPPLSMNKDYALFCKSQFKITEIEKELEKPALTETRKKRLHQEMSLAHKNSRKHSHSIDQHDLSFDKDTHAITGECNNYTISDRKSTMMLVSSLVKGFSTDDILNNLLKAFKLYNKSLQNAALKGIYQEMKLQCHPKDAPPKMKAIITNVNQKFKDIIDETEVETKAALIEDLVLLESTVKQEVKAHEETSLPNLLFGTATSFMFQGLDAINQVTLKPVIEKFFTKNTLG